MTASTRPAAGPRSSASTPPPPNRRREWSDGVTHSDGAAQDEVTAIIAHFRAALEDPGKPLALMVRFQVGEGQQSQVEAAFAKARALTRLEPGVIAYDLNRAAEPGRRFVVY